MQTLLQQPHCDSCFERFKDIKGIASAHKKFAFHSRLLLQIAFIVYTYKILKVLII